MFKKRLSFSVCLQHDRHDCGIACLLTIIKYYGGDGTIDSLRQLSGTSITGTTLLGLYQAAQQSGFDAEGCEADIDSLIAHGKPCILHVLIESSLQHYVVCFGTRSRNGKLQFIIGDPAKGVGYYSREELEQIWKSRSCLIVMPDGSFKRKSRIRKDKQKWIKNLVKEDMPFLLMAAGIGMIMAGLGLVMAVFSQRLIDNILPQKNFEKLYWGIALVFILLLVKEGLSVLRQYFLLRQSRAFNIRIIDLFYSHLLKLPVSFFDTRKTGELIARLNDTGRIQKVISQLAGNAIIDLLVVAASTIFVFTYSWQIGVICLLALPVFYGIIYLHNRKIMQGQRSVMAGYAMAENNYISTLQGVQPIKNYNKQVLFGEINKAIYKNYQDKIFSLGKVQVRLAFLANTAGVIFLAGILLFASFEVLHDHLTTGKLIAILSMCSSLLPGVAGLALTAIPVQEARIAFDRMFEFTGARPEREGNDYTMTALNDLRVSHLAFRFAGCKRLLTDVTFRISKGEMIAIMGENGCGKSTLMKILQRSYHPEAGDIIINNDTCLENISLASWRQVIGIVPQNIHLFNGTILENIAFDKAVSNTQDVIWFLQQHGFAGYIDALPQSYMTLVGEGGINLSGGQKQMIALARALYHNPQLLILDEATAAMDRQSEKFVLELLQQLKNRMAVIFITHRLNILKAFCNRIYILENGIVTASGNHDQLMHSDNLYSQYWTDIVA